MSNSKYRIVCEFQNNTILPCYSRLKEEHIAILQSYNAPVILEKLEFF